MATVRRDTAAGAPVDIGRIERHDETGDAMAHADTPTDAACVENPVTGG